MSLLGVMMALIATAGQPGPPDSPAWVTDPPKKPLRIGSDALHERFAAAGVSEGYVKFAVVDRADEVPAKDIPVATMRTSKRWAAKILRVVDQKQIEEAEWSGYRCRHASGERMVASWQTPVGRVSWIDNAGPAMDCIASCQLMVDFDQPASLDSEQDAKDFLDRVGFGLLRIPKARTAWNDTRVRRLGDTRPAVWIITVLRDMDVKADGAITEPVYWYKSIQAVTDGAHMIMRFRLQDSEYHSGLSTKQSYRLDMPFTSRFAP